MSDYEEPSELFEKPRGERRWLGREHHRGKERLFEAVKGRTFIEKTVSSQEPMSKKAVSRINDSTKDELELNVVYSLDKKNRWRDADIITLLGSAPEDVNAEVVQKNGLEQFGFLYPNKSTFSVTSKVVSREDAPGEFGIRSATSSGKGQDYSNFVAKSRELSKKANARVKIEEEESAEQQPTVSYNIYKTHRSVDAVGGQMFKAKVVSKSGKHRANKKIDMEVYEDFEDYEDEEEEEVEQQVRSSVMDLSEYVIPSRNQKKHKNSKFSIVKPSEELKASPIPKPSEPVSDFPDVLNTHEILYSEGFTFQQADVVLPNMEENFEQQMKFVSLEKGLKIKDLRPGQYLIDASECCQLDGGSKDGETTVVIVITYLKERNLNVLVNSTIASHPSQRGENFLRKLISKSSSILEVLKLITSRLWMNRKIIKTMKHSSSFYGQKSFSEMLQECGEWENQLINMDWPNRHYHSTWANSKELSTVGSVLEWPDLCEMIKQPRPARTCTPFQGDACGVCSRQKRLYELFVTTDETKVKCTECLRDEFYKELRARRVPIDLKTDCADELEYLPTFIPLPMINAYVRLMAENLLECSNLEQCSSCKSTIQFPNSQKSMRSCPCGYSWCQDCKGVPHWPMECKEYLEWSRKWELKYAFMRAQGSGQEALLQITCPCEKAIYNVCVPTDFLQCPACKNYIRYKNWKTCWKPKYVPLESPLRKYWKQGYWRLEWAHKEKLYVPVAKVSTEMSKIPMLAEPVANFCAQVHDVRFNEAIRNRAVNREHVLLRKNLLDGGESVENAMGTVVYLTEMVTAWMHVTNQYDRSVKNLLEMMMENRKVLVEMLEKEDSEGVMETLKKIRKGIDSVVKAVEKKTDK